MRPPSPRSGALSSPAKPHAPAGASPSPVPSTMRKLGVFPNGTPQPLSCIGCKHSARNHGSLLRKRFHKATSETSAQCAHFARTAVSRKERPLSKAILKLALILKQKHSLGFESQKPQSAQGSVKRQASHPAPDVSTSGLASNRRIQVPIEHAAALKLP